MLRPRKRQFTTRLWATSFLSIAALVTGAVLAAYLLGAIRGAELGSVDARFAIRGTQGTPPEVALVQIDDVTFGDLQVQWPFPRKLHARLIDRLRKAGAQVIAYDVQFSEPTTVAQDNALIEAVARAGNVVLAATEVDANGNTNVFGGADLRQFRTRAGSALFPPDPGGVLRRVPYAEEKLVSYAVASAEVALGHKIDPASLGGKTAWIDFRGPPGTIAHYSFSNVLNGKFPPNAFRGRAVVVGPSAPSLQDVHVTSATGDELMSGAEVQANAIWTALHGFPLKSAPKALTIALIVLFGLLAPLVSFRLALRGTLLVGLGTLALYVVVTQLAFDQGVVLSFVYPSLALVLSTVAAMGAHYSIAAFERQRTRDAFSRFVPEKVVDQVLDQAGSGLRLGGRSLVATVMFSDVRGFTTFSEGRSPEDVIEVVNRYLTEMTEVVLDHGGTLIDFLGDGFMAVFGAPLEQDDHADRAVAAGKRMIGDVLPRFNVWLAGQGYERGFRIGVGLNTGTVVSGNVGSERRLAYTTIGDVVNSASRIEGLTKGTRHMLLLSDTTREALASPPPDLVFVDDFEVRGREATIALWSLESVSDAPEEQAPEAAAAVQPA
jgi:adenylate cyclase